MSTRENFLIAAIGLAICALGYLIYRLYLFFKSPFVYPYFVHYFDISGKRSGKELDYVENFLLVASNRQWLENHQKSILAWKKKSEDYLQTCLFPEYRAKQYRRALDDATAYRFYFERAQTRYTQRNYIKSAYQVTVNDGVCCFDWPGLEDRIRQLAAIGFSATLSDYYSSNQRKLMTPALRKAIMERDDYTCQICSKYMPDEVGLHIDHIVPIAKGGKTIASNLRVLCSKCNGRKGAK